MKKFLLILVSLFIMGTPSVMAQASKVAGKVTDASGMPLIGVSVTVKDTVKGTATDVDGNYVLDAQKTDVLVFEFLGYKSQEITVGAQTVINVSLTEDTTAIDQVGVVGYGIQHRFYILILGIYRTI